jgi:hypothetical protein
VAGPYSTGYESNLFPEVTMSHWRRSHEPATEHPYFADWVIVAIAVVVLALGLVVYGAR